MNDIRLKQSRSVVMEMVAEEDLYHLTLVGNIRDRAGRVKLVAENAAGVATVDANLSVAGSPPTFVEPPYISQVLEGQYYLCRQPVKAINL